MYIYEHIREFMENLHHITEYSLLEIYSVLKFEWCISTSLCAKNTDKTGELLWQFNVFFSV